MEIALVGAICLAAGLQYQKVASLTADATTLESLGLDGDTVYRWRKRRLVLWWDGQEKTPAATHRRPPTGCVGFLESRTLPPCSSRVAEKLSGIMSQRIAAEVLGVSHTTVERDLTDGTNVPTVASEVAEISHSDDGTGTNVPPEYFMDEDFNPAIPKKPLRQMSHPTKKKRLKPAILRT